MHLLFVHIAENNILKQAEILVWIAKIARNYPKQAV
jgi:hypothetical protein